MTTKGTIRFEDLGEPVQRLLRSLKGGYTEEDMALLEFVSVKDMAKIYGEMSTDRHAEEIWEELRAALQARRAKASRRDSELQARAAALEAQAAAEAAQAAAEQAAAAEAAEAERQRRRETRRQRREEKEKEREREVEAEEEEEARRLLREQEAAEEAAEEAARQEKAEKRRRRREARARELKEEQEALAAERARNAADAGRGGTNGTQKKAWEAYVASHPLEFTNESSQHIEQKHVEHSLKAPPQATTQLLNRTYTPKCPNCSTKFAIPPQLWECPVCLRRLRQHIKVWQPDDSSDKCMACQAPIGRFSRHHCRNCGRLVCNSCSETRALIPALGFKGVMKICDDCANLKNRST